MYYLLGLGMLWFMEVLLRFIWHNMHLSFKINTYIHDLILQDELILLCPKLLMSSSLTSDISSSRVTWGLELVEKISWRQSCNGHNLCPKVINLNPTQHQWTFFVQERGTHSSNNSILCKFDYAILVCLFYFQFEEPFTLHLYFGCSYLSNIVQ